MRLFPSLAVTWKATGWPTATIRWPAWGAIVIATLSTGSTLTVSVLFVAAPCESTAWNEMVARPEKFVSGVNTFADQRSVGGGRAR